MNFKYSLSGPSGEIARLIINHLPCAKRDELLAHLAILEAAKEIMDYNRMLNALDTMIDGGDIDGDDPNAHLWLCDTATVDQIQNNPNEIILDIITD